MSKTLSFTVHPASADAEYLTVSDAMRQILDLIEALERTESISAGSRQIVWRLTEAHTSSPPFTVIAEAFAINPVVSVGLEASRLTEMFGLGFGALLDGNVVDWIDHDIAIPLRRVLQRNLGGVGRTEIAISEDVRFNIVPENARIAFSALEQIDIAVEAAIVDYSRTEYGSAEIEIHSITRWNDKPALSAIERLSRDKVTCVLTQELADQLGGHSWGEVWEGRRLLIGGALHYARDGILRRVDADSAEEMPWTSVSLADLSSIDILQGRSVAEHIDLLRSDDLG